MGCHLESRFINLWVKPIHRETIHMDQTNKNDKELLNASLGGDPHAFAGIVERYQSLVCAVAYSGTGDLGLSEDLAQETFLAAWRSLATLRDWRKLNSWLCGIARNLARDQRRRQFRDVAHQARSLEETAEAPDESLTPRELAERRERETVLWRALECIPDTYREPLVLFYREGQSVSAVAEGLGLSEESVRQRLSRGRKLLKGQVAQIVEETLAQTRPPTSFTARVMSALPAAVKPTGAGAASIAGGGITAGFLASVLGIFAAVLGGLDAARMSVASSQSLRHRRYALRRASFIYAYITGFLGLQGAIGLLLWRTPAALLRVSLVAWILYFAGILLLFYTGFRGYARVRDLDNRR